jgi:hypothetical protein
MTQACRDLNLPSAAMKLAGFSSEYLEGQGSLRAVARNLDDSLPRGAAVFSWDYDLQNIYQVLSEREDLRFPPALDSVWTHRTRGDLDAWMQLRRVSVECQSVFVLARGTDSEESLQAASASALGQGGLNCGARIGLTKVSTYSTGVHGMLQILLYRAMPSP